MIRYLLRRLRRLRILRKVVLERLTEPLHLNLISLAVLLGGTFKQRVAFDLVIRQQYAFGLLKSAEFARTLGIDRLTAIEFGVAQGAGMMNLCELAAKVTRATGVAFDIVGFDTGTGMPELSDHRDHPEVYAPGDFPMPDRDKLLARLPENATIYFGDVADTAAEFLASAPPEIGFVSVDLDYYTSTKEALQLFSGEPANYLPKTIFYFDDVMMDWHNEFCGELAAIREFNSKHELRKLTKYNYLSKNRIFTRAKWIDAMYILHVLDHPARQPGQLDRPPLVLENSYLD